MLINNKQLEEYVKQIENYKKFLINRGWGIVGNQCIKNNKKYSFYSALDHEIIKDLKKSGWKTASIMGVFIDSKNNQHPHKTLQCFLHPKSNRVYRFVDAEFIFKEKNNDDIEFYKNETGWPKYINESLEKQNFKVKENDLITYHVKANSNNDLEYTIKEIKKLRSNK